MASILKNNVVFLHIPKTGGTWVKKVLEDEGLLVADYSHEHSTYDYFAAATRLLRKRNYFYRLQKRRFLVDDPKFFCVVRNPLTWYESWYKFQIARNFEKWGSVGDPGKWHVMSALNDLVTDDFNQFMENVNTRVPGFVTSLYAMYTANSGATAVRLENIHVEMADFLTKSGIAVAPEKLKAKEKENVSPEIRIAWDPDLRERTIRNEIAAFSRYGYDPN